jgi:hypothetical protein
MGYKSRKIAKQCFCFAEPQGQSSVSGASAALGPGVFQGVHKQKMVGKSQRDIGEVTEM